MAKFYITSFYTSLVVIKTVDLTFLCSRVYIHFKRNQ